VIPDYEIKDAFENLARLKGSKIKKVDSIMLHAAMVLYMCAGLKKKEISEVKIQDVKYEGGRISGIDPNSQGRNDNFLQLTGFPAQVLHEYLGHLRSSGKYRIVPDSPLFPNYEGDSGQKKLSRHLEKIPPFRIGDFTEKWDFNKLMEYGIADHYKNIIKSGRTHDEAIQSTARQYRFNERSVVDNLTQNKKQIQDSFEKLLKHWDELIIKKFSDQKEVETFREEGIELIKSMRIKGKRKIKEMFNNSIDDCVARQAPNTKNTDYPNDFREVLKILKRAVDEHRDELDTRKRIERYSKKMEKYYFDEGSK
jgi:hypothetical protein